MKLNWECPFCKHKAIVHDGNEGTIFEFRHTFNHGNKLGQQYLKGMVVVCPNENCLEYPIQASLGGREQYMNGWRDAKARRTWRLIPDSEAKVFPSYIPQTLLDDYREACLIRDLSPKASATLSRRCLQGMIRDFWGIKKARLKDEIDALENRVDASTWEAIDSIRKVGNIGAHMEKDINLVLDVEPEEAQLLIELIETLLEEWYVARYEREQRMAKVKAVAAAKEKSKVAPAVTAAASS